MSPSDGAPSDYERDVRAALEDSVSRIDARVRSRLNMARHAALAELAGPRSGWWRHRALLPTGVAAAALMVVGLVVWHQRPYSPVSGGSQTAVEDLELLADDEAFELIGDDGAFYEWAAAQSDEGGASG